MFIVKFTKQRKVVELRWNSLAGHDFPGDEQREVNTTQFDVIVDFSLIIATKRKGIDNGCAKQRSFFFLHSLAGARVREQSKV